jgi:salicylate hydroxylase
MKDLLAMMELERRWAISDRDPVRHWSKGRVTLLGDAAHPVLQSYAQGACMAMEDAVCLAELMQLCAGDYAQAFQRYQAMRCVRTARLTLESRTLWDVYHAEDIAREALWQQLSERSDDDVYQCLAWIYDGVEVPRGS